MALSSLAIDGGEPICTQPFPDWPQNDEAPKIENALTSQTKAIAPVHMAGHPVDLDAIMQIAARHNLRVVEDACHAWGAEWKGRRVGATTSGLRYRGTKRAS